VVEAEQQRGFDSSWFANSMASRASFQGLTTSSAQRGTVVAADSDAATSLARRVGRRSYRVKAVVGREELGGDAVQPGTTSSLHLYGSRGGSNAT
jgi:hypothetical protein